MVRFLCVPMLFCASTLGVWLLATWEDEEVTTEPGGKRSKKLHWTFPTRVDNVTQVASELHQYKVQHYAYTLSLFVACYLYKQAFAIPGSFFLNVLAGAVFGLWEGFALACVLSTVGATLCFILSDLFGKAYVLHYCAERIAALQQKMDENRDRLLLFLLFGRMFPISPSWLLNVMAPFLNVPLHLFILSVFLVYCFCDSAAQCDNAKLEKPYAGLAPYNFVCVQAGVILSEVHSWRDVFSTAVLLKLSAIAIVPLALALWLRPRNWTSSSSATHEKLTPERLPSKDSSILPV